MLALARRGVVADRVDVLVRVGLGRLGMVGHHYIPQRYRIDTSSTGRSDIGKVYLCRLAEIEREREEGQRYAFLLQLYASFSPLNRPLGSLLDKSMRLDMENALFRKLQDAIEHPTRSKDWFSMAEQAINTIYALGERPDIVCDKIIRNLTRRAFAPQTRAKTPPPKDPDAMDKDVPQDVAEEGADASQADSSQANNTQSDEPKDSSDAFALSQLLFVVGHVAIKHIVYLELVEREWKRQKNEKEAGTWLRACVPSSRMLIFFPAEKATKKGGAANSAKDQEELDQVTGNAEDEIGDRIATIRESELLYGSDSLLAIYGPMAVHICGSPHRFKVSSDELHVLCQLTSWLRIGHCALRPHSHSANSCALAPSSATNITTFCSRSSRRQRIRTSEAILSLRWETSPSRSITSLMRIATSCTKVSPTLIS